VFKDKVMDPCLIGGYSTFQIVIASQIYILCSKFIVKKYEIDCH
jgi:hypothetical protein